MRLIDADALQEEYKKYYDGKRALLIDVAPTVDPQHKVRFSDEDHVWIDGKQYISLRRFMGAVKEAQPQSTKLDEWCDDCAEYDKTTHSCPRFNRVIRNTIDDVRKDAYKHGKSKGIKKGRAMAQRWIPVTEKLPERGKDVLVTRDYDGRADHIKSCRYVEVASCYGEDDDVSWNSYSDEYKMTPKNHHVVAWMPLPEPYKGEER